MRTEHIGSILSVRAAEDCIRATKKYTKGAFSRAAQHPVQGQDFPSKALTEYYEVYPDMEVGLDMSIIDAIFWLAGDAPHIDVRFHYNYSCDKAMMVVFGGNGVVELLKEGIPGLANAIAGIEEHGTGEQEA